MFRKGGSTSYGTGITANLEPRTNYEGGGGTGYEEIINRQYQSMLPSQGDLVSNLITGFGASAPQDPMQLQTWGSAFGSAGRTAAALRAKQEAPAIEYRKQAGVQAIKNLTAPEKDQIFRFAKERARILQIPEKDRSLVDRNRLLFIDNELKKTQQYLREASPEAKMENSIIEKEKEFISTGKVRMNPRKAAETAAKINAGKIKIPGGYTGVISVTSQGLSDIIPQGDGTTAVLNTKKSGININNVSYQPNQNYIDPQTGAVYQYQGKGTFKRVYP